VAGMSYYEALSPLLDALDGDELREGEGTLEDGYIFGDLITLLHRHWASRNADRLPPECLDGSDLVTCDSSVRVCTEGTRPLECDLTAPLFSYQSDLVSYEELLADAFLDKLNREHRRERRLTEGARRELARFAWPGNVRELEHVIMRAVLRAVRGRSRDEAFTVDLEHLDVDERRPVREGGAPPPVQLPEGDVSLHDAVDAFQRALIARTVEHTEGNWAEAARRLGVDKSNLHRLARRLALK